MLPEALTALAAAGGSAVVQAAGSDVWEGLSSRLAQWFGRGDAQRARDELQRLERTASDLTTADPAVVEQLGARQEAMWQLRIEALLEALDDAEERERTAARLRQLLQEAAPPVPGGGGQTSGNTFNGPTFLQNGARSVQNIRFGSSA
ncbi:hypothetical protein [Streptomyces sp. NPDC093260]|uniref:hypothetical protein n=1 Tax=Streptomyces sp. NPDC093260 TaxID=3155073 RepID=UPI00343E556D